jgi:hypothetical protein
LLHRFFHAHPGFEELVQAENGTGVPPDSGGNRRVTVAVFKKTSRRFWKSLVMTSVDMGRFFWELIHARFGDAWTRASSLGVVQSKLFEC